MNQEVLSYLPLVSPVATLAILMLGVFLQARQLDNRLSDFRDLMAALLKAESAERKKDIAELKFEFKADIGGLETRLTGQIAKLDARIQHIEEQRVLR